MLATPAFHHLHLNSIDPDAAIAFYTHQFPSTSKGTWAGLPALLSPNSVLILFNKVDTQPATSPPSAIWHFGWHVTDVRANITAYQARPEVKLLPLYTTDEGGSVLINSDTWPAPKGSAPGLTRSQIAEAKANGVRPVGGGGFAYMQGPDGARVEYVGNHPAERFDHVHLWQDDVHAALRWYQTHLNAPLRPGSTLSSGLPEQSVKRGPDRSWPALNREGMFREPRAGVVFGDIVLTWYANQGNAPLAPSRGQLQDHIALSVSDLGLWIRKLSGEGVKFLEQPYQLGDTRAVMIEGPSKEALELVEMTGQ
jgi:catechol 2,3-dioxygenase-like lactoylglutathione lyase family enzyme